MHMLQKGGVYIKITVVGGGNIGTQFAVYSAHSGQNGDALIPDLHSRYFTASQT